MSMQQDLLQRFYEWDSDLPRCLSARRKLREHQTALGADSSGERKETIDSEQGGHSSRCKTFLNLSSSSHCYEIRRKLHSRTLG